MTDDEAAKLIAPAVLARGSRWADLGAGTGTFTRALAALLAPGAEEKHHTEPQSHREKARRASLFSLCGSAALCEPNLLKFSA